MIDSNSKERGEPITKKELVVGVEFQSSSGAQYRLVDIRDGKYGVIRTNSDLWDEKDIFWWLLGSFSNDMERSSR